MNRNSIAENVITQEYMNDMTLEECRGIAQARRSANYGNDTEWKFYDFVMTACDTLYEIETAIRNLKP